MNAGEQQMVLDLIESLCDSAGIPFEDERRRVVRRIMGQHVDGRLEVCPNRACRTRVEDMLWHPEGDDRNCCPRCGASILRIGVKVVSESERGVA